MYCSSKNYYIQHTTVNEMLGRVYDPGKGCFKASNLAHLFPYVILFLTCTKIKCKLKKEVIPLKDYISLYVLRSFTSLMTFLTRIVKRWKLVNSSPFFGATGLWENSCFHWERTDENRILLRIRVRKLLWICEMPFLLEVEKDLGCRKVGWLVLS